MANPHSSKLKLPVEVQATFEKKNWDAFNYIFWGTNSIILGLFIVEFFLLKDLWQSLLLFKLVIIAFGLLVYAFVKPSLKAPDWMILGVLILFSSYCFLVIMLSDDFSVTVYFSILMLVVGSANYILLWKPKFAFFEVTTILSIFFLFQFEDNFESYELRMNLGGYAFIAVLILTAFIPDARKRNYLLNLEQDLKKNKLIQIQNKRLQKVQLDLLEAQEILKINNEKEKLIRHDLKNKFTNIIGLSQLIVPENGVITDEDMTYLQLLKDVSTDLLSYSDTIFSTQDEKSSDSLKMKPDQIELLSSYRKVAFGLKPKLDQKGVKLPLSDQGKNLFIFADFLVFNTVIENILNYLINWSSSDQEVRLDTSRTDGNIQIQFSAPSANIPSDDLNRIFKPLENFTFESSFDTPKGLGLQIAKSMTERMGGYFKYQTDIQGGVVFKIEFPEVAPSTQQIS